MKLVQQLRQKQILAPQLIQSLKMLQMPVLKLEQKIRVELATNPLLEEVDEPDLEQEQEESESEIDLGDKDKEKDDSDDGADLEAYLFDDDEGYKVREPREHVEERFEGTAATVSTLYDYLNEQLLMLNLSDNEQFIGEYIIGNIAPDGFLTLNVPEMAERLPKYAEENAPELASQFTFDVETIDAVLRKVQRFDPSGVGAVDLRESLMIQLREKKLENTLAFRIVDEHINELDRRSILQVSKMMGVTVERAQQAMNTIKSLSPTPAHGRFDSGAMPVVPDLVVDRFGDDYQVVHNDSYVPRLRINASYRNLIRRGSKSSKDTKDYIRQKLDQAKWLMNAIAQRRSTMVRVMEALIERQKEFFERGPAFLKPLIMEDIAQDVDMNVATISRVANGKYVQTPFGVREIRYFFNSGITRDDGSDMSKISVKQRITEIIKDEPPEKPFSDQEIFRRLNEEGIKLARRTVTKYREELKIPPARLRKRVV